MSLDEVYVAARLYVIAQEEVERRRAELARSCQRAADKASDRELAEVCGRAKLALTRARIQQLRNTPNA